MDLSDKYFTETKRQVYVTPVMFMGVFEVFEQLLTRKNEEIERERSKYDQGVKKLEEAKIMIESFSPTQGSKFGGTLVTITGGHFSDNI